jgi:hypothetical protein
MFKTRPVNKKIKHFRSDKLTYEDLYSEIQRMAKEMPPPKKSKAVEDVPKEKIKKVPIYKKAGTYLKKGGRITMRGGKEGIKFAKKEIQTVRKYPSRIDESAKRDIEEIEERYGPIMHPVYIPEEDYAAYMIAIPKKNKKKNKTKKKPKKIDPFILTGDSDKKQENLAIKMKKAKKEWDSLVEQAYKAEYE